MGIVTPAGFQTASCSIGATQKIIACLYPVDYLSTVERNKLIRTLYQAGATLSDLAKQFELSPQRIHQLVNKRHH